MKKRILFLCLVLMFICVSLMGCSSVTTTDTMSGATNDGVVLQFSAEFFDNSGDKWLEVEGNNFDLKTNKTKIYGYDSEGSWDYWYETSSIVSCYIDGSQIDTCGSTVIFKDKRIEPCDIDFTEVLSSLSVDSIKEISDENFLTAEDWLRIRFWWDTQSSNGGDSKKRLVVVQSQLGNPITMFAGDEVTWEVSKLPKTTHITIDGKELYLHRANFAIVDTELLPSN